MAEETVSVRFKPGARVRPMHGLTSRTGTIREVRLTTAGPAYTVRWDEGQVRGPYLGTELRRIAAVEVNFSDWLDKRVQKQSRAWAEKFSVGAQSRAWAASVDKKSRKPQKPEPACMAATRMRMGWAEEASRRQWRERRIAG